MAKEKKMGGGSKNFANMPTKEKMHAYPKAHYGLGESLDDTIVGIDKNSKYNAKKVSGNLSKSMY